MKNKEKLQSFMSKDSVDLLNKTMVHNLYSISGNFFGKFYIKSVIFNFCVEFIPVLNMKFKISAVI